MTSCIECSINGIFDSRLSYHLLVQHHLRDALTKPALLVRWYICPAGFLRGWPVGVELIAGLPERPGSQQRHFLQAPKDVFVCSVLIYVQRIRGFTTMRHINLRFTYLFTYLRFVGTSCRETSNGLLFRASLYAQMFPSAGQVGAERSATGGRHGKSQRRGVEIG